MKTLLELKGIGQISTSEVPVGKTKQKQSMNKSIDRKCQMTSVFRKC